MGGEGFPAASRCHLASDRFPQGVTQKIAAPEHRGSSGKEMPVNAETLRTLKQRFARWGFILV